MENVFNVQVELSANMKLLNAKNSELQSFIQRLNGNCSIIQVKILNIVLIDCYFFSLQTSCTGLEFQLVQGACPWDQY